MALWKRSHIFSHIVEKSIVLYSVLAFYPLNTLVTLKSLRLELGNWLPLFTELPRRLILGNSALWGPVYLATTPDVAGDKKEGRRLSVGMTCSGPTPQDGAARTLIVLVREAPGK